ncbi:MAG: DUF4810 domain-containing protein [Gammaproteobacteria bacterium]
MIRLLPVALLVLAAGCASVSEQYSWGGYEDQIYLSYARPGDMPPERQAEGMEKDYQVARAANRRMPPGWHAQLGYVYYQLGRLDQAEQQLRTEKAEYPESAVFVDRLMANLKRP